MKNRVYSIAKILLTVLYLFGFSNILFAKPAKIVHTDFNSLILEFSLPDLQIQKRTLHGQTFDLIKFDGSSYLRHEGLPFLPIYVETVGIPPDSTPEVEVLADEKTNDGPYSILPYQREHPRQPQKQDRLIIDRDFYQTRKFYPEKIVEIEPIGYIREQRIGRVRIYPIQYNPGTGQIRIHKHLTVRINMKAGKSDTHHAPRITSHAPQLKSGATNPYEQLFKTTLINYEQAKTFRKTRPAFPESLEQSVASGPVRISSNSYKITITDDGLYKLTYGMLKNAGADFLDVDVSTIKMFSEGEEISIYVHGGKDGSFDPGDYIVFYGKAIVNSKFTDVNVYFISWGGNKGLRPVTVSGEPQNNTEASFAFRTKEHFEKDRLHDPLITVKSELVDHYFWSGFTGNSGRDTHTYPLSLPYAAKQTDTESAPDLSPLLQLGERAVIRLRFQGISHAQNEKHVAVVLFNSKLLEVFRWNGQENSIFEVKMPQNYISQDDKNFLTIECHDKNQTPENELDFCLDWFEIEYWRNFHAHSGRLEFSSIIASEVLATSATSSDLIRYEIEGFSRSEIDLFEIGEKGITAEIVNGVIEEEPPPVNYKLVVETHSTVPTKYYAVQESSYRRPELIEKYKSAGLRNPNNQADYIIISHEKFLNSIDRLAEFRRTTHRVQSGGLSVMVVDIEDIYDEFSNGLFNPMAIKSFLRYAYNNWTSPKPSYVLLVGDAHWDYKNAYVEYYREIGQEKDIPPIFVPTYHGWSPEGGETAMDQKFVEVSGEDSLPDMFIGRLPVQTNSELENVIEKIINYEQNKKTGLWQSRIMQIADNDTDNAGDDTFQSSREILVDEVIPPSVETREVYLKELVSPYRTKQKIIDNMREGVVAMEYSGHGGVDSWAHEGIFMLSDIHSVRNDHLPFVITTTCLNGMFDKPVEPGHYSISEEFLLIEDYGAIANLSASRLTYAEANAAYDADLFRNMFAINPPIIGAIIYTAKIDFITKQSRLWWPNVEQYNLLGDPATILSLPQLEIQVETKDKSLDASQKLVIERGSVGKRGYAEEDKFVKSENFNADLVLSVTYPNNLDKIADNDLPVSQKTVPLWNGEYGQIEIDIPVADEPNFRVIPGDGIVRMFATDGEETAIGGIRFSMYNPVILSNNNRFSEDEKFLLIEVKIADNKGAAGIKKVSCEWNNTVEFKTHVTEMIPSEGKSGVWYELKEPIPLPKGGKLIKYTIIVEDDEDNIVSTKKSTVEAPIGANLTIARYPDSGSPMIAYEYSDQYKAWTLTAQLINNGGKNVRSAIWTYFFDGNPDRNGDNIVDEEAIAETEPPSLHHTVLVGRVRVSVDEWQTQEDGRSDILQSSVVNLQLHTSLKSGYHNIYVWADPELPGYDHEDHIDGEITEPYSHDNKVYTLLPINDFILMDEVLTAYSLDNILKIFFPKDATEPTTISISSIPLSLTGKAARSTSEFYGNSATDDTAIVGDSLKFKQPDVVPAILPGKTEHEAFSIKLASDVTYLKKNAEISIKFDTLKLKEQVIEKTGIREGPQLETQVLKEANKLAIYSWMPDIQMWKKLDSELTVAEVAKTSGDTYPAGEEYISSPVAENESDQVLSQNQIKIDPDTTPIGEWVILFLDSQHYEVMLKRSEAKNNYDVLERQGKVGEIYRDEMTGIELDIPDSTTAEESAEQASVFEFGDTFYFRTSFDTYYGGTKVHNVRHSNYGDGNAHIKIKEENVDKEIFGEYVIFCLNSQDYEIRDQNNNPLKFSSMNVIYGRVNQSSSFPSLGIEVNLRAAERGFNFGDKFKFKITKVGGVSAKIKKLSTFSLMQNNDDTPPELQFWVNGQEAQSSSVIPPRPEISLLISDSNGIDIDSFSFEISKNVGESNHENTEGTENSSALDFQDVPEDDYVVNNQVTTVTVKYTPILYIGKYTYRLSVKDLNGNSIQTDTDATGTGSKDCMEYLFFVEEQPDLTPPLITVEVKRAAGSSDGSLPVVEQTARLLDEGDVLTGPSIFRVNITDEHGIDSDSVSFSFSSLPSLNSAIDDYNLDFDKDDPTTAVITCAPDLPNGDYQIEIEVADTSKNTEQSQIQFSMDESVVVSNLFNVPNPFKRDTSFVYEFTQIPTDVTIKIYTVTGRLIRTIVMASANRHYNEQYWDGRDENGNRLANGTYFYKFIVQTEGKKIIKYGKLSVLR